MNLTDLRIQSFASAPDFVHQLVGGAVLSPKHARELTPSLCLAIASALSELQQQQQQQSSSSHQQQLHSTVPYTVWITEAWRVLGWAEPSAALFWEMATLYHTLHLAGQSAMDAAAASYIPPILSCGSTSSMGSNQTPNTVNNAAAAEKKKYAATTVSAKELPAWLVGTFLLLHCEECAYHRNLSGQDDRRFYPGQHQQQQQQQQQPVLGNVDFNSLLEHNTLSPR